MLVIDYQTCMSPIPDPVRGRNNNKETIVVDEGKIETDFFVLKCKEIRVIMFMNQCEYDCVIHCVIVS